MLLLLNLLLLMQLECFSRALARVNCVDWQHKLVGFGCDGVSVNVSVNGLRGYLEESIPGSVVSGVSYIVCC